MVTFDWVSCFVYPVIGGMLISLATSLNMFLKGRITGFSGILYNIWSYEDSNNAWRWSLVYGLVCASSIIKSSSGSTFFDNQTEFVKGLNIWGFIIGGFLVGFGTKLSNGCTSGHGVCGLPRLSIRSIVAVLTFVTLGIATSTLKYYVPFLNSTNELLDFQNNIYSLSDFMKYNYPLIVLGVATLIYAIYFIYTWKKSNYNNYNKSDLITGLSVGVIFGLGLCISGMVKRTKVINFLSLSSTWDPSLLFVLLVSVCLNFFTFKFILAKVELPPYADKPINFPQMKVDKTLVFGAAIFGIGWGLSGLCPGPVMCNTFFYFPVIVIFLVMIILGQLVAKKVQNCLNKKVESNNNNKV